MASRDIANMHLFLDLKKKFPDLPDDILRNYVTLYAEDKPKCTSLLQKELKNHCYPSQTLSDFRLPDYRASSRTDEVNFFPSGIHNASSSVQIPSGRSTSHAGILHAPNVPFKSESMSAPIIMADREKPFSHIYQQVPVSSHNPSDKDKYNKMIFSTTKEHIILPPVSHTSTAYLSKISEPESSERHCVKLSITPSFPFQQPQFNAVNNAICATSSRTHGYHTTSLNFQLSPKPSDPIEISTIPTNLCKSRDFSSRVQVSVDSEGATFTAVSVAKPSSHLITCEESQAQNSILFKHFSSKMQPSFGINFRYPLEQVSFQKELGSGTFDSLQSYHSPFDYILAVKNHQIAQLDLILDELEKEKNLCSSLKTVLSKMEEEMTQRSSSKDSVFSGEELNKLRKENRKLRIECNCLLMEVDMCSTGQIPLGVTDEDFYSNIFTGPNGAISSSPARAPGLDRRKLGIECKNRLSFENDEDDEKYRWKCKKCTFANHPALEKCEICEMPKNSGSFFGGT